MRESNSQVEVILENITDEFFAVDPEWRFTYINRQALLRIKEATGQSLTREDLLGKSVWEMLPEQVGSVFYQKYHEAMREQTTVHFEQYLPPTGEWCEVHVYPSEEGLAVYVQDVTERKQAEERFRATFERAAVGIAHVSVDGRMLRINEKLCEILGYAREELLDLAVHEISYPEDHDVDLAQYRRMLSGEIDSYTIEKRFVRKDRSLVWTNLVVSLVRDPSGKPEYSIGAVEDITERKQAEEALRRSEERFKAQYRGIPIPTISWRRVGDDFELSDYNGAADRMTQGGLADLMGMRASEWYSDNPQIMGALSRCYGEGTTIHHESPWHMRTTGEHKHLAVTFAYIPPDLVVTHVEDITERKRAEEALEENHTLLRSIIEGASDPIFLKDTQCRFLLANSSAAEVLGTSVDELLGKESAEFMPPETARRTMEVDRRVIETNESQSGEEHMTVQGVQRTYLFTKTPYRDRRGEVAGVIGIGRDITERKQAEVALRQSKERFHSLVQYSSDIITILASDGTGRYQSPAIQLILGYEPEELIEKNVFAYVHPEDLDRVLSAFDHLLNNPETHPMVEFRFRNKDGSWRYLEAIGSNLLQDPGIAGVVINSRDITERKKLEENQQRFFANAAHQLKTPITTIVGAAELLVTIQGLDDPKKSQLLDHIFSEALRMQRLSDDLLRLAKMGRDRRDPEPEAVDLTAASRQAAGRMMPLAENLGLTLRVVGDGGRALADPEWLQEVLLILLSNAAKYSDPAREIRLEARENTIAVEDEGAGISNADLPHVFERFYRGKGNTEGFGLGLSIGRELVERMGGSISISSREGSGTRVELELPGTDTYA